MHKYMNSDQTNLVVDEEGELRVVEAGGLLAKQLQYPL